jgi:hypothetical protein
VNLPVAVHDGDLLIIDQDTGQAFPIGQASDHTLAAAVEKIAEFDRDLFTAKRAVAAELRARHGVGKSVAGGYEFTVAESQSWPVGAVTEALSKLLEEGRISACGSQPGVAGQAASGSAAVEESDRPVDRHGPGGCRVVGCCLHGVTGVGAWRDGSDRGGEPMTAVTVAEETARTSTDERRRGITRRARGPWRGCARSRLANRSTLEWCQDTGEDHYIKGPMSRGITRERALKAVLESQDHFVVRAAGSLGNADLVALKAGKRPMLIEVKSDAHRPYTHFGPARRAELRLAAELAGADAWLVWWPPRRDPVWIQLGSAWPGVQGQEEEAA